MKNGFRNFSRVVSFATIISSLFFCMQVLAIGTTTTVKTGFNFPYDVEVDGNGNIYVADTFNHVIKKMDSNGENMVSLGTGFNSIHGVAVDGNGRIYVVDANNARIMRMDSDGANTLTIGSGFSAPCGVAVDSSGNIYVADRTYGYIIKMNSAGGNRTNLGSGFINPYKVALDSSGNIYVADYGNKVVKKMNSSGGNITTLGSGFQSITDVALDSEGNIYVADPFDYSVKMMNANGENITKIGSWLYMPYGLDVAGNGDIYVAESGNNAIKKITLPSSNAGLTSVAGQTDAMPAGGNGTSAGTAITWMINVDSTKSAIGRADITSASNATYKLYSNNSFTTEITGSASVALTAGGATTVYIKVTAEDTTTVKYYAVTVNRDPSNWQDNGNIDTSWYGEGSASTFNIGTATQLAGFASLVNSDITFNGKTINLTSDIDLSAHEWTPIAKYGKEVSDPFMPWFSYTTNYYFEGTFNGNDHVIGGMRINNSTSDHQGLFGYINGTVKNLGIINATVTGQNNVGGLGGNTSGATILKCYVSASSITGGDSVGGLIGYSSFGSVDSCLANCTVTASGYFTGGLIGSSSPTPVKNCVSMGTVTATGSLAIAGGLIGDASSNSETVSNSYSMANVYG